MNKNAKLGKGIAVGMAIGVAFGVAMDNISLGIAIAANRCGNWFRIEQRAEKER